MDGLFLALMAALVVAGMIIHRKARDPEDPFGRWFQSRVQSRLPGLVTGFFLVTFLVWAAIYVTAPEEDRGNLTKTFKGWFDTKER
ncbi:MAG: hypothetical protein CMM60_11700 [Rhodospirillaceae bacterium]|nr:hypothetical protein [Rhodospirillaceae bacterium]